MISLKEVREKAKNMNFNRMSPTRARQFRENPARALYNLTGDYPWWSGDSTALDYGTIVHSLVEDGMMVDLSDELKTNMLGKRGQTLKWAREAQVVGEHARTFFDVIEGNKMYETELTITNDDGSKFHGYADVINEDLNDRIAVYDIKTLNTKDFDRWLLKPAEWSREPDALHEYIKQIAFYTLVTNADEAVLLFVRKSEDAPFLHEYKILDAELVNAQKEVLADMTYALNVIKDIEPATAKNDGSKWAFSYFGGKI